MFLESRMMKEYTIQPAKEITAEERLSKTQLVSNANTVERLS
jgi:hypothetical protein